MAEPTLTPLEEYLYKENASLRMEIACLENLVKSWITTVDCLHRKYRPEDFKDEGDKEAQGK